MRSSTPLPHRLALCVLALVLGPACDSGAEGPLPSVGWFEAAVTGDVEARFSGDATVQRQTLAPGEPASLSVVMTARDVTTGRTRHSLGFLDPDGVVDGPGTYSLDLAERGLSLTYLDRSSGLPFGAVAGSVRITLFEEGRVEGTFQADLLDPFVEGGERRARVEGSFRARALAAPR